MNLLIFILFVYGLSNILVFSAGPFNIFLKIRILAKKLPSNLGDVFDCMICMPTWIGMGLSLFNMLLYPTVNISPFYGIVQDTQHWYIVMLLDAMVASASTWLIHTLQEYFEKHTENE